MSEPTATSTATDSDAAPAGAAGVTESDFLDQQARVAKAAISAALADAKAALAEGVDPATWARRYPVVAIGSALVAGFAAALVAIPSKQQQELARIEKIARALHPTPEKPASPPKQEKAEGAAAASSPIWMTIVKEALAFARPLLAALASSHLGSPPPAPENGDGQAPPVTPPPAAAAAAYPRR
jgi:hypothetical protein